MGEEVHVRRGWPYVEAFGGRALLDLRWELDLIGST